MDRVNFYEVLGVQKDAGDDDIRNAYRRLAMKWHPDRHALSSDKATVEEKFKTVLQAYKTLSDEGKRRIYDLENTSFQDHFSHGGSRFNNHEEWEKEEAERQRKYRESIYPKGGDIKWKAAVPLHVAMRGGEVVYSRKRRIVCSSCDGDGWYEEVCARCRETGFVGSGINRRYCVQCSGRGVLEIDCTACQGKGKVSETVITRIRVPAGVVDGSEMVARGLGKPSRYFEGLFGDLLITIAIKPEDGFKFSGLDMAGLIKIPFSMAMLGGKFLVVLPTGRHVEVDIPARSNSGKKIRLVACGLVSKEGQVGDVVLSVSIVLPKTKRRLSQGEEALLRSLDN